MLYPVLFQISEANREIFEKNISRVENTGTFEKTRGFSDLSATKYTVYHSLPYRPNFISVV
jgi:hypothetical protein